MSADLSTHPGDARSRGVRRTALFMSLLAFAIYATFIIASVLRAG